MQPFFQAPSIGLEDVPAIMDGMDGWAIDPESLAPVVLDREQVQAALTRAGALDRLRYLRILGRIEEGLDEAIGLLSTEPADPWQLLLLTADLHRARGDLTTAAGLQERAWRQARSRDRQADTLLAVGERHFDAGDVDTAASCFQLALTMYRGFVGPAALERCAVALQAARRRAGFAAVVLAGGSGVRLGGQSLGAKALIPLGGWPLADHVLLAVAAADRRIQVGPARIALGDPEFALEDPPGSGPVAGLAAALDRIDHPLVAVLAGDLPFIGPALFALRAAVGDRDAAVLVDTTGRINYLAAVWRTSALRAAVEALDDTANAPMRALYRSALVEHVPDFDAGSADVDTPADLAAATERLRRRNPGRLPASPLAWPRLALHAPS